MSFDDEHETLRNVLLAAGLGIVALAGVGLMFFLMSGLPGAQLTVNTVPQATSSTTTGEASASAPAPTSTTTFVPPSPSWTPSVTLSLPPPEQPTMTAPVPGQTADPDPNQPAAATAPAPAPSSPVAAPSSAPPSPPPAVATVGNVSLGCSKDKGRKVTARLTFTTSAKVDVVLVAGANADQRQAGPGNVTMSTNGRGPEVCVAKIGGQTVGPVPAQ